MVQPISKNTDGQPIFEFRYQENRRRDFTTLLGICEGLVADQMLKDSETLYLSMWLDNCGHRISDDPDVIDISDIIRDILKDGHVTQDELDDLKEQLITVLDYRLKPDTLDTDQALRRLSGLVHGILADNQLRNEEIHHLQNWLESCGEARHLWPASALHRRIKGAMADGVISHQERADLLEALTLITGGSITETGTVGGFTSRAFVLDFPQDHQIDFEGKNFVLTGKFVFGPRKTCEHHIAARGGIIGNNITKKTDYLIVGTLASRDWAHETHGRKLETAMTRHAKGANLVVLTEQTWARQL